MRETNLFFVSTCALFMFLLLYFPKSGSAPYVAYGKAGESDAVTTVIFVGDIMLAREVERIMDLTDPFYPFSGLKDLISRADIAVGNFEASVPEEHLETPDFGFRFSAEKSTLPLLKNIGFDYLSLANNHAFDFGLPGYRHTQAVCTRANLICGGAPETMSEVSRSIIHTEDSVVGMLAIDATKAYPGKELVSKELQALRAGSDVQIAYVHWGEEYEKVHNKAQEQFAHFLIQEGIDAVIGHHPHVVQDVDVYQGKPIFYSLGNFIFDQYFSDEVQQGLVIQLQISKETLRYTLIPVTSITTPSQPQLMGLDERDAFLSDLDVPPILTFARSGVARETIISTMEGHK